MDILIKNMEMPKSCSACKCVQRYRYSDECEHLRKPIAKNGRLKDCPLIELPPHGDLIDRQKVLSYFETGYLMGANMDYEDINEIVRKVVPTVLEAST